MAGQQYFSSTTCASGILPLHDHPNAAPPKSLKDSQPHSPPNSYWANAYGPYEQCYPDINTPPHTAGTFEPHLQHPPPAHTATPLLTHDIEGDPWPINQYITSDPRFRDSTLVFPRIRQHSNSSWPFWKRHRVTILTVLATSVALGFVLAAIIGSVKIKND
jgi:hypothetical protein